MTELLYEMLNRERESAAARGPFGYAAAGDGRAGFPHPPHARLPAPFSTVVPDSSGGCRGVLPSHMEAFGSVAHRGGVSALVESSVGTSDRLPLLSQDQHHEHHHPVPVGVVAYNGIPGDDRRSFESSSNSNSLKGLKRGGVSGGGGSGGGGSGGVDSSISAFFHPQRGGVSSSPCFSPYPFDRQYRGHPHSAETHCASEVGAALHHRGAWPGPEGPYTTTGAVFSKCHKGQERSGGSDIGSVGPGNVRGGAQQC